MWTSLLLVVLVPIRQLHGEHGVCWSLTSRRPRILTAITAGVDIALTDATGINVAAMITTVLAVTHCRHLQPTQQQRWVRLQPRRLTHLASLVISASRLQRRLLTQVLQLLLVVRTTDHVSLLATNSATLALNTSGVDNVNIKEATGASTISFTNSDASLVALDTDNAITLTGLGASTNLQFGLTALGDVQLNDADGVEDTTVTATYASVSGTSDAVTVNLADTDAGATAILDIDGIESLTFNHIGQKARLPSKTTRSRLLARLTPLTRSQCLPAVTLRTR